MNRWMPAGAHLSRLALGAAAAAAVIGINPGETKAALTYNIFESGSDVVIATSGSLNLSSPIANNLRCSASGALLRQNSLICTGAGNVNMNKYNITLMGTDGLFSNSIAAVFANSVSGTYNTNLTGSGGSIYFGTNAPSGASIVSTTTFNSTTLASLGFTTTGLIGTWTLNDSGDSIYVCVGSAYCGPPGVPTPGPLPLFGAGAAFAWSRRLRQRIGTPRSGAPRADRLFFPARP
jgi:MYXO-CTERM domain-containing protein